MNGGDSDGASRRGARTGTRTPPGGNDPIIAETASPIGGEVLAAGIADDLRAQIQRAEGVLAELRAMINEHRQAATEAADSARGAAFSAGQAEVSRFQQFLTGEMNVAMQSFDGAVHRARAAVLASIRPRLVQIDARSGWVTVQFDGDMPSEASREPR
jgi:flagellar biosynthesis/type III secretory pathway protein FliH